MSRRILACLVLTIASGGALGASQSRTPSTTTQITGRIAGAVTSAESGVPVRFAQVTLSSGAGDVTVVTDETGGFSFDGLGSGAYTIKVTKLGYLDTAYGQIRPGTDTPVKQIRLRAGEQITRLSLPLSHGGSISGVIRDDRGEPPYRASVRVSRWVRRNGVRSLETVESTQTDERGMYRISLLAPRTYIVSVTPDDGAIPNGPNSPQPYGFAPVFYPSAPTASAASTITLGLGEDRANIDMQLPLVPLARVTGIVLDQDGRPAADVQVSLASRAASEDGSGPGAKTGADGRFVIDKVGPGPYLATAGARSAASGYMFLSVEKGLIEFTVSDAVTVVDDKNRLSPSALRRTDETTRRMVRGSATAEVFVSGGAAADLILTLEPPRAVAGRMAIDGTSPPPALRDIQIVLTEVGGSSGSVLVKIGADGTFAEPYVAPGRYAVNIFGDKPPWRLASAVSGGTDALDFLLTVPRDRDVRDLTVTLRDRASELSGTVMDPAGQPVGDRTVIAFPADERMWATATERVQAASLGTDGRFTFTLRPGAYRLALVESIEPDEWHDPALLRELVGSSLSITLAAGERKVQDLRVR